MSEITYTLKLDIRSYWRAGSGNQAGAYADQLVIKQDGLPYLPGRQLKGILRKAFSTAEQAGWVDSDDLKQLFGEEEKGQGQGIIQVSNALLPETERNYFQQNKNNKSLLYHTKDVQAVDHNSGTTKSGSLRTMEVTVPMVLQAEISLNQQLSNKEINKKFGHWLENCCCLISAVGADRNRGLGNVVVTVEQENNQ